MYVLRQGLLFEEGAIVQYTARSVICLNGYLLGRVYGVRTMVPASVIFSCERTQSTRTEDKLMLILR